VGRVHGEATVELAIEWFKKKRIFRSVESKWLKNPELLKADARRKHSRKEHIEEKTRHQRGGKLDEKRRCPLKILEGGG